MSLVSLDDIHEAQERLAGVAIRSGLYPLNPATFGLAELPYKLWIKAEQEQPIGSFKLRGAYNKIAALTPEERSRGVVAYSSGNHAQGVAYAADKLGTKAMIVMPNTSPKIKQEATRRLGGEVILVGPSSNERKERAEALQAELGLSLVPPYDDDHTIAGTGTIAIEMLEQNPQLDLLLAPVSGGGLISGIATAAKLTRSNMKVIGVEPELASDATASFHAKKMVEWPVADTGRTIADGLRAQHLGERNFAHILAYVDGFLTVTEEEILRTTRLLLEHTPWVAEPSGAVALAAALFHANELPSAHDVGIVLSGGNLDPALREQLLAAHV